MFKRKHSAPQATYREVWSKGRWAAKAQFFIMGCNALAHRQWAKGFSLLLSELVFIFWMIFGGYSALNMLVSLGPNKTKKLVFDQAQGQYVTQQPSNSVIILLYGVLAVLICIGFIYLYIVNLRSNRATYILEKKHKKIPTNREELHSLLDSRLHATLMLFPIVGILLFTVLPTIFMISMAFTNYNSHHAIAFSWTGFQAFGDVLDGDLSGTFFPVLTWTLVWAVMATVTTFFFGVLLAILINVKGIKYKKVWRTLFIICYAVPQFVSLLMIAQFLDPQGPLNTLLMNLGWLAKPIHFLDDQAAPLMAKVMVIVINMWIGIPIVMLESTAIIQNLPEDQIEAAKIDGANAVQVFQHITFPQILFVMSPALIQQFITNVNNFNVIFLLTGGGPYNIHYNGAGSTDLLVTWLYNLTFGTTQRYNASAVLGILIFIISAVVSLIAYRHTTAFKEG